MTIYYLQILPDDGRWRDPATPYGDLDVVAERFARAVGPTDATAEWLATEAAIVRNALLDPTTAAVETFSPENGWWVCVEKDDDGDA